MLELENVTLFVAGKVLIGEANIKVTPGSRIGIVGRNGCGKSHLLQVMASKLRPDAGQVKVTNDDRVLLVKQELPDQTMSPMDYLRSVDPDLTRLDKAIDDAMDKNNDDALADLFNDQGVIEGERYSTLAPRILRGLGLKDEQHEAPMSNLSGGYQMRVALAAALVQQPDILLMDEPTNHLDLESTLWLVEFLRDYPASKSVVIVSHDPNLLNQLTTSTWHLKGGRIDVYGGSYDVYKRESVIKAEQDKKNNEELDKQIKDKMQFYYEFRQRPARAGQAMDRLRQVERLKEEKVEIVPEQPVAPIAFAEPGQLGDPIVELRNASVGYDKNVVLKGMNLSIQYGSKIGLLGRNGQGKSTLVKLVTERIKPISGLVLNNPRLRIGYFSQDAKDELDVTKTVWEQFRDGTGINNEETLRSKLATFGFGRENIGTKVGDLSGGEMSRLAFAIICAREPHLIVLDEPTNHLDVETREQLTQAIKDFKGSVLLVSHDWDLQKETMQKFWVVRNGAASEHFQGLDNYRDRINQTISKTLQRNIGTASSTSVGNSSHSLNGNGKGKAKGKEKVNTATNAANNGPASRGRKKGRR